LRIVTRKARAEDLDVLYRIEMECFGRDAFTRGLLAYFLALSDFVNLVAEVDGKIAGFLVGSIRRVGSRKIGHIYTVDVSRKYRRVGVASKLLSDLEKIYLENEVDVCYLEVRVDNVAALNLYRKHGFVVVETLKGYYGFRIDGFRLMKKLRS